jgi:ketosteroid isomerase-like protein
VSERNVELHRRALRAFNARDVEALLAYCDPEIEFHSAVTAPVSGGLYHGHEGVRRWHRDFEEVWGDEVSVAPEAFFHLGEQTLGFGVVKGRGKESGAEVTAPIAQVARWRDGLMVYYKGYLNREEALRDLGISEDSLEPIAP